VIAQKEQSPRRQILTNSSCGIREQDGGATKRSKQTHSKNDTLGWMALIKVHAAGKTRDRNSPELTQHELAGVSCHGGPREPGNQAIGDPNRHRQLVGERPET
jgi:hypothetical protein